MKIEKIEPKIPAPDAVEVLPPAAPACRAAGSNVLGIHVSATNLDSATESVLAAVRAGAPAHVCVANTHSLIECRRDPALRAIFDAAHLVVPDGMPLVWALQRGGHGSAGRVYGPDLMLSLFDRGRAVGLRHFLYGTTPATLDKLEARLVARFPGARVVGHYAPPFRPLTGEEELQVAEAINASEADVIWVGLSTPKQERWMSAMRPYLRAPVMLGVGAAFDFHAGLKPQAPAVLQRHGLEWAFRLWTEPRRLWKRYLTTVPHYLLLDAAGRTGLIRFAGPESRLAPGGEALQ